MSEFTSESVPTKQMANLTTSCHSSQSSPEEEHPERKSLIPAELLRQLPRDPLRQSVLPLNIRLTELNPYLVCGLCQGYLYKASTITECMHTFCINCIVRHASVSTLCPVCDTVIHPTDPFVHIKRDIVLQDIVSKLLPHVAKEEERRIEEFYTTHSRDAPGYNPQPTILRRAAVRLAKPQTHAAQKEGQSPPTLVSLRLEYAGSSSGVDIQPVVKKFLRVSGKATAGNVATFIKRKLHLEDSLMVNLFCYDEDLETEEVERELTLQSIRDQYYQHDPDPDSLMLIQYRISRVT